jgi:16S rRNA G966 N2-methylase RsmD
MLLKWFDANEAQEFGKKLAENYSVKFTVLEQKKEKAATVAKRAKLLDSMTLETKQFGMTHKLNIYKKAKLSNAFKWVLLDKGYDTKFIDELTKELILALK